MTIKPSIAPYSFTCPYCGTKVLKGEVCSEIPGKYHQTFEVGKRMLRVRRRDILYVEN